jgi:glycosyltransferase involved in cell wall biosynthesis
MCSYERPQHLRLALSGYLHQSVGDYEILVADDGSGPETAEAVERFAKRAPFPVHHVWQPDRGYRRTAILNRAIVKTSADYVVFTDGDCVPAPDLLERHLGERRPGRMLIGGYVRVPRELGDRVDENWVASRGYQTRLTPWTRWQLQRRHWKNLWQIWTRRRRRPHNLGLNMSLWKADLLRVNGFDENIVNWGNDDGDLRERLKMVGVWPRSIWNRALVFHLDHAVEESSKNPRANRAYVRRPNIPAFAENGIVKRRAG